MDVGSCNDVDFQDRKTPMTSIYESERYIKVSIDFSFSILKGKFFSSKFPTERRHGFVICHYYCSDVPIIKKVFCFFCILKALTNLNLCHREKLSQKQMLLPRG